MAITPGYTFADGEQVTATKLNTLVSGATPLNLNRTHMEAGSQVVTAGPSEPSSPEAGELHFDTNATGLILKVYTGTEWLSVSTRQEIPLTCQAVGSAGDVVVLDSGNATSVTLTTTANHQRVVGVLGAAVASAPSTARVVRSGLVTLNCTTAAVAIGDELATSTTSGKAAATTAGGGFAIALTSKGAGSAGTVTALLRGGSRTPNIYSASYATYTMTAASLTDPNFYFVPGSALGSGVLATSGTAMKVDVVTTRANQPVTVTLSGFRMTTGSGTAQRIDAFRLTLADETVLATGETKGSPFLPSAAASWELIGNNTIIYVTAAQAAWGLAVPLASFTVVVPTAGSHSICLQFRADCTGTVAYTTTSASTATMVAVVH